MTDEQFLASLEPWERAALSDEAQAEFRRISDEILQPTASAEYLALVEDANLDWQVSQYIRHVRLGHVILATVIWEIAAAQHGELVFQRAVANYDSPRD